jgi:leucyl-tRNA synthetase
VLKITEYADRLIDDLKTVDYLPQIAAQQVNWIGKSQGAEVDFLAGEHKITVFTTRADTLSGATFLVLAPEHPLVAKLTTADQKYQVEAYVKKTQAESEVSRQETDRQKTGVWTGSYAKNPLTGKDVPVWTADYVLVGYGTGAIMAVPAHDERDYEFAQVFNLPIKVAVEPVTGKVQDNPEFRRSIVAIVHDPKTDKYLSINWGEQAGGNLFIGGGVDEGEDVVACAKREIAEETGFTDVKLVEQSENVHHHYFAHSKNQAREILATGLYFELTSDEKTETKLEADETGKFQVEWLTKAEATARVRDELHGYLFAKFVLNKPYTGDGPLVDAGDFTGLSGHEARQAIIAWLHEEGLGKGKTTYKLRDWIFSRQHYWGEPIPMIHCAKDGVVPVPEDQLPVELPPVEHYEPTDTGESPLALITDWVNVPCPKCGGPAKRETDTMPNWAGSSWYYLRYIDAQNDQAFADPDKLKKWLMVDLYNGGMEHTTLHLLYSRFWHKFLYDQGLVPTSEPYARRRSHGMILSDDGRKMSKSLGNVINPDAVVEKFGADALRLYEMFMGPFDEATSWSDERLAGANRFLYRVWDLAFKLINAQGDEHNGTFELATDRITHKTLKKVHEDIQDMHFNTMVSALMEYVNYLTKADNQAKLLVDRELARRTARYLILMLAPMIPHAAEELWAELGETDSVHVAPWPAYDPELIKDDMATIVIQVNGKVRANIVMPVAATNEQLETAAKADPIVARNLDGQTIVRTIVVPRKIVNFVVKA